MIVIVHLNTEIKGALSVENPEQTNVLLLKPGVGQNIAAPVLPTARNFFLVTGLLNWCKRTLKM